jgi:hypothetical protein
VARSVRIAASLLPAFGVVPVVSGGGDGGVFGGDGGGGGGEGGGGGG